MRRLFITAGIMLMLLPFFTNSVQGQGGNIPFNWREPLNPGEMPTNRPSLPAAVNMPTLPLEERLVSGTLFFNIESYLEQYSVLNVTLDGLDDRFFAYNITYIYGIHPVSPNGQYGIYTVPDGSIDVITCGILDLLTEVTVDRFATTGGCNQNNIKWSPDSTRVLFQINDEQGREALGIRQNGATSVIRPIPVTGADTANQVIQDNSFYVPRGWLNSDVFYFEIGTNGSVSETLYTDIAQPLVARPASSLLFEDSLTRIVLSNPAQPVGEPHRSLILNDLITGDRFSIAPPDHIARVAEIGPDNTRVVYWAETVLGPGTTHPLRLVIYEPDTDAQVVLLRFDGNPNDFLQTRPGRLVWNEDGIYFHIEQQAGALSPLQTGTYRIQPDGTDLIFITPELLWRAIQ